jgi:hypothetical protein
MTQQTLIFKPTEEDALAVSRAATFNKPTIVLIGIMALVSLGTLLALAAGWMSPAGDRLLFYLLPPLTFIYFLIYTPIRLRRQARETAARDEESRWQVTEQGITIEKEEASDEHPWRSFSHAQELPEQFILFFAANRSEYIFLPKRAFSSSEQEEAFRNLLESHLRLTQG